MAKDKDTQAKWKTIEAELESTLEELDQIPVDVSRIQAQLNKDDRDVGRRIKDLLQRVGIHDEMVVLDKERMTLRQQAQEKVNALQKRRDNLIVTRDELQAKVVAGGSVVPLRPSDNIEGDKDAPS